MKSKIQDIYEEHSFVFSLGATVACIVVWVFSTFATAKEVASVKKDVALQKIELTKYVDDQHAEVRSDLQEIKNTQQEQNNRLFTILSEVRKH